MVVGGWASQHSHCHGRARGLAGGLARTTAGRHSAAQMQTAAAVRGERKVVCRTVVCARKWVVSARPVAAGGRPA